MWQVFSVSRYMAYIFLYFATNTAQYLHSLDAWWRQSRDSLAGSHKSEHDEWMIDQLLRLPLLTSLCSQPAAATLIGWSLYCKSALVSRWIDCIILCCARPPSLTKRINWLQRFILLNVAMFRTSADATGHCALFLKRAIGQRIESLLFSSVLAGHSVKLLATWLHRRSRVYLIILIQRRHVHVINGVNNRHNDAARRTSQNTNGSIADLKTNWKKTPLKVSSQNQNRLNKCQVNCWDFSFQSLQWSALFDTCRQRI